MTFRASHLFVNGPEIQGVFGVTSLPLTTVAHIISYLDDDVASLSRLCRTSRSLYYMSLPHLWKSVTLTSHNSIRYKDGQPEGVGSASPFLMGLNALVTGKVAPLVRSITLQGEFGGPETLDYSRAGRVSEQGMVLNIAICAALDRCTQLESFRWDLNTRIQPNVYSSLVRLPRLRALWLRFPTDRAPHPIAEIPAMPNITSLTVTHYDPLCHPDDVATFMVNADKLEALQLHFSPRMRDQGEASVVLTQLFRKNIVSQKKITLKRIGIYNLLAQIDPSDCLLAFKSDQVENFTALNCFGPDESLIQASSKATYFVDKTWLVAIDGPYPKPKSLRLDQLHRRHALDLARSPGLERLYLVNARHKPPQEVNGFHHSTPSSVDHSPSSGTTNSNGSSNCSMSSNRSPPVPNTSLRDLYMDSICNVCGPTLKHLILPARWPLPQGLVARLIRSAPNLTQLSAPILCSDMDVMRLLMPFLTRLWAIRILAPIQNDAEGSKMASEFRKFVDHLGASKFGECAEENKLAIQLARGNSDGGVFDFPKLRYIGIGEVVFELGGMIEMNVRTPVGRSFRDTSCEEPFTDDGDQEMHDEVITTRRVFRISEDEVKHVEIWKMDSMDVI